MAGITPPTPTNEIVIRQSDLRMLAENIHVAQQGEVLIIVIDTSVDQGLSQSGKSHIVASSRGFLPATKETKLSLNLIR